MRAVAASLVLCLAVVTATLTVNNQPSSILSETPTQKNSAELFKENILLSVHDQLTSGTPNSVLQQFIGTTRTRILGDLAEVKQKLTDIQAAGAKRIQDLEKQRNEANLRLAVGKADLQSTRDNIDRLKSEIESIAEQVTSLQESIHQIDNETDVRTARRQREHAAYMAKYSEQQEYLKAVDHVVAALTSKANNKTKPSLVEVDASVPTAKDHLKELYDLLDRLSGDAKAEIKALDAAESQQQQAHKDALADLKADRENTQKTISKLEEDQEQKETEQDTAEDREANLAMQCRQTADDIDNINVLISVEQAAVVQKVKDLIEQRTVLNNELNTLNNLEQLLKAEIAQQAPFLPPALPKFRERLEQMNRQTSAAANPAQEP